MTDKEKLMQILNVPIFPRTDADPLEAVADYLLDNDVRPVKHGHWVHKYGASECSECKSKHCGKDGAFCECCGAKMDNG